MSNQKKKELFLIGGVALVALVAVIVLIAVLGGGSGKRYEKHYEAAEAAFLRRDYDAALSELDKALDAGATEEAYLLMADVYYAQGEAEQAIQALYLGYSRVGGDAIGSMLERLKRETESADASSAETGGVTVAGKTFAPDVTAVVLSGKGLGNEDFAALCTLTELESLSVSDNAISDLTPVAGLQKLTSLQISNNNVSDLSALGGLGNLKTLYLDGNPVRDLTPLYRLGGLKTLSMKNVSVSAADLAALKEALDTCSVFADAGEETVTEITLGGRTFFSDVTELNLGGLELTDISPLSACHDLVRLDLRDNKITDISPLVELQNLEWLCLWNNAVEDVTPLMSLTKLRYLDVDTNKLTGITALEYLTELEELWLNNNAIRRFGALEKLAGLTRLGLKNTGIDDAQLDVLFGLSELQELNLEDNEGVSANKFEELREALPKCAISHSELLWTVTLGGKTYRSDAAEIDASGLGINALNGLEHFTKLEILNLDDNKITDLSPLYGLKSLKTVSLRGNGLGAEAVTALREQLPGCEVVSDREIPEADAMAVARGVSAATDVAGTGSGYAILWQEDDAVAAGVRAGFLRQAETLGMNVVLDSGIPTDAADLSSWLRALESLGADVVVVTADDAVTARITEQAAALGYSPDFMQVY